MSKPRKGNGKAPKLRSDLSISDLENLTAQIEAIRKQKHREKHELLGAVIAKVLDDPADSGLKSDVLALLKTKLIKDKDRAVFGLEPLPKTAKAKGKKKAATA